MRRRAFLAASAGLGACSAPVIPPDPELPPPGFAKGRETLYRESPRTAVLSWFRQAGPGLFFDYGVYTQLGRGPWAQFEDRIPPGRYSELASTFDPAGFDAAALAEVATGCGFGYVGIPARHADGFSLFRTIETDFNTLEASGRDLVGELNDACEARGLGLTASYSYAADWRHPYFFAPEDSRTEWKRSRPEFPDPEPRYKFQKDEDFLHYVRYAHNQLQELAYRYRSLAALRFEPIEGYRARPDLFPVEQAYSVLREGRPGMLVSFGLGVTGDEDFISIDAGSDSSPADGRPLEIAHRLGAPEAGGPDGLRAASAGLATALGDASDRQANLLVRVELRADGSLRPADEQVLREFAHGQPA